MLRVVSFKTITQIQTVLNRCIKSLDCSFPQRAKVKTRESSSLDQRLLLRILQSLKDMLNKVLRDREWISYLGKDPTQ